MIDESFAGALAYALTKRLVMDMPTARAIVDEAAKDIVPVKLVDDVMAVSESLEACMVAARCPLKDRQILLLRGQLMVWLPKLLVRKRK